MDEDGKKEENQASTSKKEKNDDDDDIDQRDDPRNYKDDRSYTSESSVITGPPSRLEMRADNRPDGGTKMIGPKRDKDDRKDKRKKIRRGRVSKRKRSPVKRHYQYQGNSKKTVKRKPPKTQTFKTYRDSVSTIFTRMSSRSSSNSPGCQYCGHGCCGRRIRTKEATATGGKNNLQSK